MKTKLINLMSQRATLLGEMENALQSGDQTAFAGMRVKMTDLETEISNTRAFLTLQENNANPRDQLDRNEQLEQRADDLINKKSITFTSNEVRAALFANSTTIDSGELAMPTAAGTQIHDRTGNPNSILDMVRIVDLTGTQGIQEPYLKGELTAQVGNVETTSGTARTATDPTFGYSNIRPKDVNVTSYVDRNIADLSPVAYVQKVQSLALKALRKKIANLIYVGDGDASPTMYGMINGVDADGDEMYGTVAATASTINENTLASLYYAVGTDEEIGGGRLFLNKADLVKLGSIRGTNEKKRLFEITADPSNMNIGTIKDGGMVIPYCLTSALLPLSTTTAGTAVKSTMVYGDPMAYELGLFGGYSIRVNDSTKAAERLLTILGDVKVGGNLVEDKAIVVAQIAATGGN